MVLRRTKEKVMRVREEFRAEHTLPDVRWRVLREQRRREEAAARVAEERNQKMREEPGAAVRVFMERLRNQLDRLVKEGGGTEHSVLRRRLLQWDAKATGRLSSGQLSSALASLGLRTDKAECDAVLAYYGDEYDKLCSAVACRHFLQHRPEENYPHAQPESSRAPVSPLVRRFVKKLRRKLGAMVERNGEYEKIILRRAFMDWGTSPSAKVGVRQLIGAMRQVGMKISEDEATEILEAFSFSHESLTTVVCEEVPHFFNAVSRTKKKISGANQKEQDLEDEKVLWKLFTARPVDGPIPKRNAVVEEFKANLRKALDKRAKSGGGTPPSLLREACLFWDADASGELNAREFRGAMARLGLLLSKDHALQVIRYYDRNGKVGKYGDGEIHYKDLVDDVLRHVPHFTAQAAASTARKGHHHHHPEEEGVDVRPPANVNAVLAKIREGTVVAAAAKRIKPRDLILGTCVRVDRDSRGKLSKSAFCRVLRELRIDRYDNRDRETSLALDDLVAWYNNDGSHRTVPYRKVVDDAFFFSVHSSLPNLHVSRVK